MLSFKLEEDSRRLGPVCWICGLTRVKSMSWIHCARRVHHYVQLFQNLIASQADQQFRFQRTYRTQPLPSAAHHEDCNCIIIIVISCLRMLIQILMCRVHWMLRQEQGLRWVTAVYKVEDFYYTHVMSASHVPRFSWTITGTKFERSNIWNSLLSIYKLPKAVGGLLYPLIRHRMSLPTSC